MQYRQPTLTSKIGAFIAIGVTIALLLIGFVLVSYILIIGAVIGLVLYIIARVVAFFKGGQANNKTYIRYRSREDKKPGRTFDNDQL